MDGRLAQDVAEPSSPTDAESATVPDERTDDARSPEGESFSEFRLPGGGQVRFYDITSGPDNALWFTLETGKIGRLTTTGQLTLFSLPDRGDVPLAIVAGPDAHLWFTMTNRMAVGRITVGGDILIFPTQQGPENLAVGPDKHIWFTAGRGWGRMSTAGELQEFDSSMFFWDILGDTRGVWAVVSDDLGKKLIRLVIDGTVSVVSTLPDNSFALARGDDSKIWFASYGNPGHVGYLGNSNEAAVLPLPVPISGLVADGKGGFWSFAPPSHLLHISADGRSRSVAIPGEAHNGSSCELTLGIDGALWFTNSADGRVQRMVF